MPSREVLGVLRRHFHEPDLVERLARFEGFSSQIALKPFAWGRDDCSLLVADWVIANGYADPAAHLRGTYADEASCMTIVESAGGLVPLFGDCLAQVGLSPAHEPRFGAVAVIGARSDIHRQWGAIWNGRAWLARFQDGFQLFTARPLAMWSV